MTDQTSPAPIHAVIGVQRNGDRTLYLRRSMLMSNYKGVWSLPSIKFDPAIIRGTPRLHHAQTLLERLSEDRLGGVPVTAISHLTSGSSSENPMAIDVTLHLYEVTTGAVPELNPRYYTEMAWMNEGEYRAASRGQTSGLCTKLWSAYSSQGYDANPGLAGSRSEGGNGGAP